MFKFSKINYLKSKWGDSSLSSAGLIRYNKYIKSIVWDVVQAELRIEQYIYETLNSSWAKASLTTKGKRDILSMNKRYQIDKNNFQSSLLIAIKENMTVGDKIVVWKAMNKTLHSDKYEIFKLGVEKSIMINVLENLRNVRNSIAHYESIEKMTSKLRNINNKKDKELVRETLRKLGI